MGAVVEEICAADPEVSVAAGFDIAEGAPHDFPVFSDPEQYTGPVDTVIDFSNPSALSKLLQFCRDRCAGVVLATTGYSPEQLEEIEKASSEIPVFRSANLSLGINVLAELVKKAAPLLDGYDIEIVERHHNRKLDAPSGTALMLAEAAASASGRDDTVYTFGRSEKRQARDPREIGISSVRGGTIVGDHEVLFCGRDEVISLSHHASSREIFASGAVRAAKFLAGKGPGLYSMEDLVAESLDSPS